MRRLTMLLATTLLGVAPCSAHISLERGEATPGSFYKAVLAVPHGCNGSATTKLTVQIPDGLIAVKPMAKPGWTVTVTKGPYDKTYNFIHGAKLSQGVREISWSGKLEDDFYDEFVFTSFVADTFAPGAAVALPTVQECERGTERWVDIPAAGQSSHALKSPAPTLRIAAAKGDSHAHMQMQGARTFKVGDITIETPWMRATPKGAPVAGGYMKITNNGTTADRLVGGSIEGAKRFEVHEMSMDGSVMRMRELPNGLEIKPGATVELKPAGLHIMGFDLAGGFTAGQTVKGTLKFEKAGEVAIEYTVAPIGAGAPDHAGHGQH